MITYREYCKRLNERKSKDCTIREDWGKTSPIPQEVYKSVTPLDDIRWVDLGFPSGTLWADVNIYNPDNRNGFWTWDEIMASEYKDFVPTMKHFGELKGCCSWDWDDERKGMVLTSEKNGNSIFLPAEGYRSIYGSKVYDENTDGNYWTSESSGDDWAYCVRFNKREVYLYSNHIPNWWSVRLVQPK